MEAIKKLKLSPIITLAALVIITAGMIAAKSIFISILLSVFISVILAKPVVWLSRKKIPDTVAIIIVLIGLLLIILGFGGIVGRTVKKFSEDAPMYEDKLNELLSGTISWLNNWGFSVSTDQISSFVDPGKVLGFTTSAIGEFGGVLANSFEVFIIVIFILLELQAFSNKAKYINKTHDVPLSKLLEVGYSIRNYLWIKTLTSLLTGVLIYVWLLIIGVEYALLWGLLAFLLNYIPNIGSIIAAVPTMLLALIISGPTALLLTLVGYFAVNMIVGNIVEPKIMGKGLGLSTLVVFLSLITWGFIFGTVGMFLSVPLTMTIKIMLEENPNTRWIAVMLGTGKEIKEG
ncbi:AI-2E family transporter [Flammeovirgaceae bacterium SG7u.111]|nr:AI-2E family transporter [Flammeovirgaceae bacterium SG7u.132]WPO33929.1 AI-2E family transporter [Flammeovirgaceae bacterium SG7u.111]